LELSDEYSVSVEEKSKFKDSLSNYYDEVAVLSRHALRAIELSSFVQAHTLSEEEENDVEKAFDKNKSLKMENFKIDKTGVLGEKEIVNLMLCHKSDKIDDSLIIMPLLDPRQICEASVDLTLGNVFIVLKRARLRLLDFDRICRKDEPIDVYEFQEMDQLRLDGTIVLHPNEFVLGSTLEYISLPKDVMSYVIGKSSLGRVGLVIATATHVAPGFRGTITLELSNLGSVPLVLYPTMPIAQLVFHKLCSPVEKGYSAKNNYAYSTGPTFSKLLMRKRRT
jgi:dCTP deaminase